MSRDRFDASQPPGIPSARRPEPYHGLVTGGTGHIGIDTHIVFMSVAQPAPLMHVYLAARAAGEEAIDSAGLSATFRRTWSVLGPEYRWPLMPMSPRFAPRISHETRVWQPDSVSA